VTVFKVEKIRQVIMKNTDHHKHLDFYSDPPLGKTITNFSPAHDLIITDLMPFKPLFKYPQSV
jgi:hypothetical protein